MAPEKLNVEVQYLLNEVTAQRNAALDQAATMSAAVIGLQRRVKELEEQLKEPKSKET